MPDNTELVVGPRAPDNETFGEILRQYRVQKGWARRFVAEELGFSSEYLRLIERGKRTPAWGQMPVIFRMYDVDYVLDGDRYVFDGVCVEFISRIREGRHKPSQDELHILVTDNRAEKIGQIVALLVTADFTTLRAVHNRLRRNA